MDREDLRVEIRVRTLVEDIQVADATLNAMINNALSVIKAAYPFPGVTITTLSTDGATPAFDAGFHDMIVDYVLARIWEREEYFEQAAIAQTAYDEKLKKMIKFYTGGRG